MGTAGMSALPGGARRDLLDGLGGAARGKEQIGEGAWLLRGFAAAELPKLLADVTRVARAAPFRIMATPGGRLMSVAMTNCGAFGWVTDASGYRYDPIDPASGKPWPPMPERFLKLAARAAQAAGYRGFVPDGCLINRYEPGARLSLHQDKDERDFAEPIVSVSLGLPAIFLWGGAKREAKPRRLRLESGDVVVWGGATRLVFHGVEPLGDGEDALAGRCRINLTLRKAR
jgi:DNA oxidative demethylase